MAAIAMLLLAACDPGTESTSTSSVTIDSPLADEVVLSGEVFYPERFALPDDSILIVEVRSDESPNATLLADLRERLDGRQVPLSFQVRVGIEELANANNPILRGAVVIRPSGFRVTEAVPLTNVSADLDLGMQRLLPITQVRFGAVFRCGTRSVVYSRLGRQARLFVDGDEVVDLEPMTAASGARYVGLGDPDTEFWNKGDQATATVHGLTLPPCHRITPPGLPFAARGQEPAWHLRIGDQSVILRADYGRRQLHLPPATATVTAAGINFHSSNQDHDLHVLVVPEICYDSMSGMPFPYLASYRLDGATHIGCGGETRDLLIGREWRVIEIDDRPVAEDSTVSIEFRLENARISGQTGCNRFLGGFALGGEGLKLGPVATTRQACQDETLNAQEQRFLETMAEVNGFDIDNHGQLILMTDGFPRIIGEP